MFNPFKRKKTDADQRVQELLDLPSDQLEARFRKAVDPKHPPSLEEAQALATVANLMEASLQPLTMNRAARRKSKRGKKK